jgi:hypothetical protein
MLDGTIVLISGIVVVMTSGLDSRSHVAMARSLS